jgi:hypothetical protein
LQSSLDQVLKHIKESTHDDSEASYAELDELLLQAVEQINTCRVASQSTSPSGQPEPRKKPVSSTAVINEIPLEQPCIAFEINPSQPASFLSFTTNPSSIPGQKKSPFANFPLLKTETLELLEYFRVEVECLYPFILFDHLTSLAAALFDLPEALPDPITDAPSEDWGNMSDSRNLDLLGVLLACALASKENRETQISCRMVAAVCKNLTIKVNGPIKYDLKDIAITALLVSPQICNCNQSCLIR